MRGEFDRRIERARELTARFPESAKLLDFYGRLGALQKAIFTDFRSTDKTNLRELTAYLPELIRLVESDGTEPLARFATEYLKSPGVAEHLLAAYWCGNAGEEAPEGEFFARVLVQPYAEYLAGRGDVNLSAAGATCPFCSAKPGVGVLRGEGDGAKRSLMCSRCATEWPYRRIVCPRCSEEQKDKLPVFLAAEIDYVRVEACDTCHHYLKSVDLTKNGHAVPEVDELATVALNLWADEHGYSKCEANLLGM